MEIKWLPPEYERHTGFAAIDKTGKQTTETYHCKEVFAERLMPLYNENDPVVRFTRKEAAHRVTPAAAKRFLAILHTFEKRMGFEPLAICEIKERHVPANEFSWYGYASPARTDKYFFYTVSRQWATSIPLIHILALLTRSRYPAGKRAYWAEIIKWMAEVRRWSMAPTIREIVTNRGAIVPNIDVGKGISDYHRHLVSTRRFYAR
jgi:hypothetical protein